MRKNDAYHLAYLLNKLGRLDEIFLIDSKGQKKRPGDIAAHKSESGDYYITIKSNKEKKC